MVVVVPVLVPREAGRLHPGDGGGGGQEEEDGHGHTSHITSDPRH